MKIYQSENYEIFQPIIGNRNINKAKVEKICSDINNGFNLLPYCPIIVSESEVKFNIIDGQHRFEASKNTKNPVYYVIAPPLTLKQIAVMNSRAEKWKPVDFLNCYINLGAKDYEDILYIMDTFRLAIKTAIDLLMFNKHTAKNSTEIFQSGEFKSNFFEETEGLLILVNDLFGRYTFSMDRYLIGAVQAIKEKGLCDFEKLKQKIASAPMMMDKQMDVKNYIYNIERVYNFKNQKRETIY